MLRQGIVSNEVAAVQFALNGAARVTSGQPPADLVCDGIFGPRTLARVLDHQKRESLVPDGIVGPLTLDTLFTKARLRSTVQITRTDTASPAPPRLAPPAFTMASSGRPILRRPGPLTLDLPAVPARRSYPDLSTWLSPSLAELARQQQAFRTWWEQPHPKPPLPAPRPYPPVIRWDLLFAQYGWVLPAPQQVMVVHGPPAPEAKRSVPVDKEGLELTTRIETEYKVTPPKPKYKWFELEMELEAPLLKSRYGELAASGSLSISKDHKDVGFTAKGALSLTEGKLKLWDENRGWFNKGVLKATTELAVAVALEGAILATELELQQKSVLEISLIRRPHDAGLTVGVGVGAGATGRLPIWVMHPGKEPDEEKVSIKPFFAGFVNLGWRF